MKMNCCFTLKLPIVKYIKEDDHFGNITSSNNNKPYTLAQGVATNECAHLQALISNVHVDLPRYLSALKKTNHLRSRQYYRSNK